MNPIMSGIFLASSMLGFATEVPGGAIQTTEVATNLDAKTSGRQASQFYVYRNGLGAEKKDVGTHSFLTLNLCMFKGRLPALFGGATAPVAERAERLAKLLEDESPDIFVAQEVPLESGDYLFEALKNQYPHFWVGIGLKPGEQESDLFVASKYPILSDPVFVPFPDEMQRVYTLPPDIQKMYPKRIIERGFFCLETEHYWMVTTHMEPGDRKQGSPYRTQQLRYLTDKMDELTTQSGKPYILAGDLNITRTAESDDEYSTTSGIPELYYDFYTEHYPRFDETTYTCTNLLTFWVNGEPVPSDLREQNEIDDYVLIRKHHKERFRNMDVRLLTNTYDLSKDPYEALTDHRAYKASFSFN